MYQLGEVFKFTLYGKSHGESVGCILEGVPKGFKINFEDLENAMNLRKPTSIGTTRKEEDPVIFVQGVVDGVTDGNPLILSIPNGDKDGSKYEKFKTMPRPGHADLPALIKFPDFDIRGGGQFSGRLTAPIVAAGTIAKQILSENGLSIGAFTKSIHTVSDEIHRTLEDVSNSRQYESRSCTSELDDKMCKAVNDARASEDSVGGVVECIVQGLPLGFGGIWFEALDSELARAIFSIPACKGVEFGDGFNITHLHGSESNDQYHFDETIKSDTNHMGGVLGGMSNGLPLVFRAAFKPTPTIGKTQNTVNLEDKKDCVLNATGRHDPCIVPRAVIVVESITALVIADQFARGF